MKKAIQFLATLAMSTFMISAAHASTKLLVDNNWDDTIEIKEGLIMSTERDIHPGERYSTSMLFSINGFSASYMTRSGHWVQIPGCTVTSSKDTHVIIGYSNSSRFVPSCTIQSY